MNKPKVLVWLSWGVDSAVAAHLLLQQWYDVIAGFMKNYAEPDDPHCTTRIDRDMAIKVAEHLGIKTFIVFDFRKEYQERIIDYIYDGYQKWLTPNPDVFCNNLIKFDLFLEQALALWCDYIATGHYARILPSSQEGVGGDHRKGLFRGIDHNKDQSYFLSRLSWYQLSHALTPLGSYTKPQIREIAHTIWLPNANRPDSQWLCFIGDVPMSEFLRKKLPERSWDILNQHWKKVGTHTGARFYTLGQRHQLFLPFRGYVTAIDVNNNIITVGDKEDKKLTTDIVSVTDRVWTGDHNDHDKIKNCLIKIRYRQDPAVHSRLISPFYKGGEGDQIEKNLSLLQFSIEPTRWITPGQILVAYSHDEQVLWSGIIL